MLPFELIIDIAEVLDKNDVIFFGLCCKDCHLALRYTPNDDIFRQKKFYGLLDSTDRIKFGIREGYIVPYRVETKICYYFYEGEIENGLDVCKLAAETGNLNLIRYARENSIVTFPWNEEIPAIAAIRGHDEVLDYVLNAGCPWDHYAGVFAMMSGCADVFNAMLRKENRRKNEYWLKVFDCFCEKCKYVDVEHAKPLLLRIKQYFQAVCPLYNTWLLKIFDAIKQPRFEIVIFGGVNEIEKESVNQYYQRNFHAIFRKHEKYIHYPRQKYEERKNEFSMTGAWVSFFGALADPYHDDTVATDEKRLTVKKCRRILKPTDRPGKIVPRQNFGRHRQIRQPRRRQRK